MSRQKQWQKEKIQRRELPAGSSSIIPIESTSASPRAGSFGSSEPSSLLI
jgi:hypothetical protein